MPGAVHEQDEYYASPSPGQSSHPQTTVDDRYQLNGAEPYSPSQPAAYLPSTTYTQPQSQPSPPRAQAPSVPNSLSRLDTSVATLQPSDNNANPPSSANPDDFYRQYSHDTQYPASSTGNLHQDAIRALSTWQGADSRAGSNGSYSTSWSADDPRDSALPPNIPGLKSRKASVKNLVAQINATSSAESPPVPTQPVVNTHAVHSMSGYLSSAHVSQFGAPPTSRKYSNPGVYSNPKSRRTESHSNQRRPLFGEIFPNQPVTQSAGYGIVNPRRRTASESSPMHSPNPMFPPDERNSQFVLSPAVYASNSQLSVHKRSNSDMPKSPAYENAPASPMAERRPPAVSRIPVSTRKMGAASDAGAAAAATAATPRKPPTAEKAFSPGVSAQSAPKRPDPNRSLQPERPKPDRITSPGRRGRPATSQQAALQQGAKSPSLRANIIAPPPKISPPLRSSRPRLPVSSASTAASRAKMAERFNALQKLNNEKRAAQLRRAKPPELTDVDFNARRLRITQALTRSRESEEMKARLQMGKRWEARSRDPSPRPESGVLPTSSAPTVKLDASQSFDEEGTYDESPDTDFAIRSALDATHNHAGQAAENEDSPTLGHDSKTFDKPSVQVQTQFLGLPDAAEPMSAVTDMTIGTEATHIDPEPQDENVADAPSVLNHVMRIRDHSPSTEYEQSPRNRDDHDDRADVESVNLVLRSTAYLDDEEAFSKGYRTNFVVSEPVPEEEDGHTSDRDSWTSSVHEDADQDDSYLHSSERSSHEQQLGYGENDTSGLSRYHGGDDSCRDTMASDAYTIINIVLQEHSSSGIVDQQFADDVYQKVLKTCPEVENEGTYDSKKIEELCLQEIVRRDEQEQEQEREQEPEQEHAAGAATRESEINDDRPTTPRHETEEDSATQQHTTTPHVAELSATDENLLTLPSMKFEGHRHKSSLDSVEDWANTSPSVGDWMRFASENVTPPDESSYQDSLAEQNRGQQTASESADSSLYHEQMSSTKPVPRLAPIEVDEDTIGPEEYGIAIIRAPSSSPPPPPKDGLPSIQQTSKTGVSTQVEVSSRQPRVPHRVTSLGQVLGPRLSPSQSRPPSTRSQSRAEITPWEVQDQPDEVPSPEIARLKKRKHVIKELIDTEYTYQRDMRVLCDIYKQTATAALTEDDIRVLFGNVEQVQLFARDFLTALKQTSKNSDRKKEKQDSIASTIHTNSSSSTLASGRVDAEASEMQRDREMRIGDAFEGSLNDMEAVYTDYIRNRHAANQRLEGLQKSTAAQEWLKECRDNSSDITNAWNLDALLVKPVQRITKYPLLLKELIDATAEDHPDLPTLKHVLISVTDINMRINDLKKHAEALDQALIRKRGQSDVRTGLSKAFGRRAEKLRQHVGIADMYEDPEYDKLRIAYDNNYVQLMVVANDCQNYEKGMIQWVDKMVQVAAAIEGWVDVGHSHHQQEESKLRHLVMIIRNVQNIALPDHIEHLHKKVIKPMLASVEILTKFKDDPKGLLHKRDKRLVDYAQMKNKKEKGEKVDKKMAERMDQWEALNTEAKDRMKKLLRATAHLVQTCQGHLVQLQMAWMALIQQKYSSVMGINNNRLSLEDIERDWQIDFDHQEASALALSICNGALMLQAANMTSFLSPGSTTLNGDDSPRQMSFSSTTNKRSISVHSESSTVPTLDFASRPSGSSSAQALLESHFDRPYPYPNGRTRAASTTSGKSLHRQDPSSRTLTNPKHTSASASYSRSGTSPTVPQDGFAPPRLSVETHSPLMSSFQVHTQPERPGSSNTFFSATAGPSNSQAQQRSRGSGVFSSALPMSDSPVRERNSAEAPFSEPQVLFTAASVYEFNIDRARREAGFPYLTYVTGEIFDVIGERGELWLAKNQDDPQKQIGWIWNKHFAKLAE